jgi:hypothetical protein
MLWALKNFRACQKCFKKIIFNSVEPRDIDLTALQMSPCHPSLQWGAFYCRFYVPFHLSLL